MTEATTRQYAGESGEERAQRRRQALLQSALVQIADQGWRQLSVDALCHEAGLHKRYFYESFQDLDALAAALIEDLAAGVYRATMGIRNAKRSVPELAHAVIDALVRNLTDDPRRARVLFGEMAASQSVMMLRKRAIRGIEAAVMERAGEVHGKAVVQSPLASLTASLLVGGTAQAVLDWLDGLIPLSREQFIDDLARLWLITGDGAAASARQPAAESKKKPRSGNEVRRARGS
jgi:AcrR family transcriptional regulator